MKKKLVNEAPYLSIIKKIRDEQVIFRYFEISNIKIKDLKRVSIFRPTLRNEVANGNGPAIASILDAISVSHKTMANLQVLSVCNV